MKLELPYFPACNWSSLANEKLTYLWAYYMPQDCFDPLDPDISKTEDPFFKLYETISAPVFLEITYQILSYFQEKNYKS